MVAYTKLNPEGVTYMDIIGGYNVSERTKKGLEVIADVYPKFGILPGTQVIVDLIHVIAYFRTILQDEPADLNGLVVTRFKLP